MKITPIGSRGRMISFPELSTTNVYLILAAKATYLCDTFLGPEPMERIKAMLMAEGRNQPIVVFNSHKDWDHVWGNCAFANASIIATERCAAKMSSHFSAELAEFGEMAQGEVVPVYPNLLFTDRLIFPDDGLLFFSSPGHTDGSASCLDMEDDILFVGDNVEHPLPYVFSSELGRYAQTLANYLELRPAGIITGHGEREIMTLDLVRANLAYVKALAAGTDLGEFEWDEESRTIHQQNLGWLADHARGTLDSISGGTREG